MWRGTWFSRSIFCTAFFAGVLASTDVGAEPGPKVKRIIHVVFENADYEEALAQPVFARLARSGVLFTQSFGVTHPSQPNYIAMIAGGTLGVKLNQEVNLDSRHLGDLFEEKGLSWANYAEDFPGNCYLGMTRGKYARKHVPFLSFRNVQRDPTRCDRIRTGDRFFRDFQARLLPEYSLFVPNLDQDGHDTDPKHASEWFQSRFEKVWSDTDFMKETLFMVTYDESEKYLGPNHILTFLFGANVRPGLEVTDHVDHYSFLLLIEGVFGLESINRNDLKARRIRGLWQ
jgi:hypothetical protein